MTKKLFFVAAILCALSLALVAADVSGKWTWEQAGRGGGNPTTSTLTLKADGSTLTGTLDGGRGGPIEITDGKVDGNSISFSVKRSFNGNDMVTPYKGTLDGDTLNLEFTQAGRGGGEPTVRKIAAKRATT
jgi:hypothetical protein